MAGPYRHQALIEAPIQEVWELVSDPHTHPDWWPDVVSVEAPDELDEGGTYNQRSTAVPFVDAVDAVWVAERLEHLREARFRCTLSGSFARFTLTPANEDTFVELEAGAESTTLRWRVLHAFGGVHLKRWTFDVLDALPHAIAARRSKAPR